MLSRPIYFSPFCLDFHRACIWRGTERITLIPKDFAILSYLATHPQRLVSHEEIFSAVWKDTVVSHGVLKVHLCRIRRALNDNAASPRFIETVPRQGYRFIAPLVSAPASLLQMQVYSFDSTMRELQLAIAMVDRNAHSAQLNEWLEEMLYKVRSLAFASQSRFSHVA